MAPVIFVAVFLDLVVLTTGLDWTCFFTGYFQCNGYEKCCPDGYICAGTSSCFSIGSIVGICIGGVIGIVTLIVFIYLCCRKPQRIQGVTFVQNPNGGAVHTINQQQYGYVLPPPYAPSAPPPGYSQLYANSNAHPMAINPDPTPYGEASFPPASTKHR